jgi:DNA-binding winged helix-turn-helix (wHTH) protein
MSAPQHTWETLPNPFRTPDTNEAIIGQASGRSTDIKNIIIGSQSAIILTGAPLIGKTTLIRYLNETSQPSTWSWRNEHNLTALRQPMNLDQCYFVQIGLAPIIQTTQLHDICQSFIKESIDALWQIHRPEQLSNFAGLRGLRELLHVMARQYPEARYFVILDAIERLLQAEMQLPDMIKSAAQTSQERAISLLNHSGILRTLVDLIDEFGNFNVILSIESLPRLSMIEQFVHVSADLARFTTTTLQCFTWDDTTAYLAQQPEDFGEDWAHMFRKLGGNTIFTEQEQAWIREQAGLHPYVLQQLCLQMFQFKQIYASTHDCWHESSENQRKALVETVNERIRPFLSLLWKRLQEVLEKSSPETKNNFYEFVSSLAHRLTEDEIFTSTWGWMGKELRYILSNEGIVRYDLLRPVYHPGAILRNYLLQQMQQVHQENKTSLTTSRNYWLTIRIPDQPQERLMLSEIEYHLLKVLFQQHPEKCSEDALMKGAWGSTIEKATFTQRMHQLRKKLRKYSQNNDMIANQYGGQYSLSHPEWLHLE